MFFQTDKLLQFNAKSDCYLFDLLKIHELTGKHEFTRDQVKDIRKVAVRAEFIGEDGYLNEKGISGVASVASGLTGVHVYMRRVTSNDNYNNIISRYTRILSGGRVVNHFVLADSLRPNKLITFDPWSKKGSRTGREGKITGFRYIFSEAI